VFRTHIVKGIGGKRSYSDTSPTPSEEDNFATAPASPTPSSRHSNSIKKGLFSSNSPSKRHVKITKETKSLETSFETTMSSFGSSVFNPLQESMRSDITESTIPDDPAHISEENSSRPTSFQIYGVTRSPETAFADLPSKVPSVLRHSSDSSALYSLESETLRQASGLTDLPVSTRNCLSTEAKKTPSALRRSSDSSAMSSLDSGMARKTSKLADRIEPLAPEHQQVQESYKVRDLPQQGFFDDTVPSLSRRVPFFLRYEHTRVISDHNAHSLSFSHLPDNYTDYRDYWNFMEMAIGSRLVKCSEKAWSVASHKEKCHAEVSISLTGKLSFVTKQSHPQLFRLHLNPMTLDKSCRFHRKFGGDRFLTILIPNLSKTPNLSQGQITSLRERFLEWMLTEKSFLGRNWRAVYLEPDKKKAVPGKVKQFCHKVTFFALSGKAIKTPMSLWDFLNWFMPLQNPANLGLTYLKAYSRLALGKII
jgi:RNA dependent RNA polymerase